MVFLNITNFRQGVFEDAPMLKVLEKASEAVFVPLTVGGGIREYTDPDGKVWSALMWPLVILLLGLTRSVSEVMLWQQQRSTLRVVRLVVIVVWSRSVSITAHRPW